MGPSQRPSPEHAVLLHGFAGTRRGWDLVVERLDRERYLPLALDLPGHGHAAGTRTGATARVDATVTFARCVDEVLAAAPPTFLLAGYSLGGRVALHVALAAPQRVSRLVLVATNPGIEDPRERAERRRADDTLAHRLEREPLAMFVERWDRQPLFAGDPPAVGELARAEYGRNQPVALAGALRGLGTGRMEPLWGRLAELEMPVDVLVGERDAKFLALGRRMLAGLRQGRLRVVAGGHRLPLENPAAVAQALEGLDAEPGAAG